VSQGKTPNKLEENEGWVDSWDIFPQPQYRLLCSSLTSWETRAIFADGWIIWYSTALYQLYKGYFASNAIGVHTRSANLKEIGRDWSVTYFKVLAEHSHGGTEENLGIPVRVIGAPTESRMIRRKRLGR
jgi:hypothetical protein